MKNTILLLIPALFLLACEKKGDLPALPSYASFKLSSSSPDKYYHVMAGDSTLDDSLKASYAISTYLTTGDQHIRIREAGIDQLIVDTTIEIQRPGAEFTLLDLGEDTPPLFYSAANLQTTAPPVGSKKYSILNIDQSSLLKGKKINLRFYELGENGFILLGELKNIEYLVPSDFVELKDTGTGQYFLEVENCETGEIIMSVDSYTASMTFYYDNNNAGLFKIMNVGDDSWAYISVERLLGVKL